MEMVVVTSEFGGNMWWVSETRMVAGLHEFDNDNDQEDDDEVVVGLFKSLAARRSLVARSEIVRKMLARFFARL